VKHSGKGFLRVTKCKFCEIVLKSKNRERWGQHVRGCLKAPTELQLALPSKGGRENNAASTSTTNTNNQAACGERKHDGIILN
jgi:hypothetical protein